MKKLLLLLALVFCVTALPANAAEEYTVQSFWSPSHKLNKVFWQAWCEEITNKSNGQVVFHYYPLNGLVKADAMPGAVRGGSLDIGGIQLQTAVAMLPHSQAIALPFLVQNAKEACTLYPLMFEKFPEMRQEVEKNFKFLAAMGSDRYAFASNNMLIKTPADIKGKRVLVWAPYQIKEVESWGGLPVQVTSAETYMGLQRGLGEIAYVPCPAVESSKLNEVAKYITYIPSRSLPIVILMNKDSWESLPDDVKKLVEETTGTKLSHFIGDQLMQLTEEDIEKHHAKGCQTYHLTLEEQQAFKDLAANANKEYWNDMLKRNGVKDPEAWINKVEKLAAKTFNR